MFESDLELIWTGDGHFYLSFNNLRLVEFMVLPPPAVDVAKSICL